ncbi:MAG: anthranilate synthase component I family protein [Actinomycetia bacterium]|nr:anthranilate synthase component I family protein [Actinomycetes bacterium]
MRASFNVAAGNTIRPSLEEAKRLAADGAQGNTVIPIALEVFSDQKTPIEVLRNIQAQSVSWFILESVNGSDSWGRYTFLGHRPVMSVYGTGDSVTVEEGVQRTQTKQPPLPLLRELLRRYKSPGIADLPPFTGGFVGYLAYDFVQHFISGLKLTAADTHGFRDFHLMLIDKVVAYDHFKQKIHIIVNIPIDDIESSYIQGVAELKDIERMILGFGQAAGSLAAGTAAGEPSACGEFEALFSEQRFKAMVEAVKEHIVEGDIFQAVISNRFTAPFQGSLMNTYRLLRIINPSPYMVYMRTDDLEIACASPETLVALRDGEISSFPLAGTCRRGATDEEDAALIEALLSDEKELAEHDMLVDLARNDLGRVSRFGSVAVSEYRRVKSLSHVSHISSKVRGRLREDKDALDVIAACLPAGTLSGAPKKRACEIIDAQEGVKRGVYGGALGYIDFAGNMDMCIGIRMVVLKDQHVYVQSGAGIVADSVAEKECREVQNKAQAVMDALIRSKEV